MIADVAALNDSGALNKGQANALTAKLEAAIQQLAKGNNTSAANQLQAFINQVNAFVKSGILSETDAQSLLAAAGCNMAQMQ